MKTHFLKKSASRKEVIVLKLKFCILNSDLVGFNSENRLILRYSAFQKALHPLLARPSNKVQIVRMRACYFNCAAQT